MQDNLKRKLLEENEIYITVKVTPRSKHTKLKSTKIIDENEVFYISLTNLAKNNKANIELIQFIKVIFKPLKTNISIINGHNSAIKLLKITNVST